MVKSVKSHLEEEDEPDDYDSSSYRGEITKMNGKSSEQKTTTHRSKHSETEQRRRSKINERFQILRNLIPQNDQKRDKASFLLEVIEYIQFLQEKLQLYEGSGQGLSQEPAKLVPWKNQHSPVEGLVDHSAVMKNDSIENTAKMNNAHNSVEPDLGTTTVSFNIQAQSNLYAAVGRSHSVPESVSDVENVAYQLQSQLWQGQPCSNDCAVPNITLNGQGEQINGSGPESISSTYSQGVLDTLTEALRSSGVDLTETSISVQIDVRKQENTRPEMAFGSKDQENLYLNNQVMGKTGFGNCDDEIDQIRKRLRMHKS